MGEYKNLADQKLDNIISFLLKHQGILQWWKLADVCIDEEQLLIKFNECTLIHTVLKASL